MMPPTARVKSWKHLTPRQMNMRQRAGEADVRCCCCGAGASTGCSFLAGKRRTGFLFVFVFVFFLFFFSRAFFRSVSVAIKGGPVHQGSANCFSEASFLTCTLFLRRAASSRAHDGYRAGSRDAPGEDGHAARRSLKSGQGPSRLLRPGEGKEVRLSLQSEREHAAKDKRVRPTNMCDALFLYKALLGSQGSGVQGEDSACPFPVSAPLCGAFSNAPVVNNACSTRRQVCYL